MSKLILSRLGVTLAVVLMAPGLVFAEGFKPNSDYRIALYDKIDFKAEAAGEGKVSMSWSPFGGHNEEKFQYYKVIRSHGNNNPLYPEQGAIAVKTDVGDTRETDNNAWKSAYYRVCAITDIKGRHCSNVVWVEIEKMKTKPSCKNFASDGSCNDAKIEKEKREKEQKEWSKSQDEAKARLAAKKAEKEAMKAKAQKEWEAKKVEAKVKAEQASSDKKAELKKAKDTKVADMKAEREKKKAELYENLYKRLDAWLADFEARLAASNASNAEKVEKIETVQTRFYAWKKDKELRIKMVAYLDVTLNELKEKYSAGDDFAEVDQFLDSLLDS